MCNGPSRSKIFKCYVENKKKQEGLTTVIFAKCLFILDEDQFTRDEIVNICQLNKYKYLVFHKQYFIYDPDPY